MSELETGTVLAGYRIEGVLGRGGMGVVHRATDEQLDRTVAIKVIASAQAQDEGFRRRFIGESRSAAAIDHAHILPVFEAGEADGVLYLVTRLVDGSDLGQHLATAGAITPPEAVDVIEQVGAALDAAHDRGLIHRDVKPANVLLTHEGRRHGTHCYLTDFGLAKRANTDTSLTTPGQFVGTLDYIAPEQVRGEHVDGQADQYSLGAVLYECLTGSPPFVRDGDPALMWAHMNDEPPRVSERLPDVVGLDWVVARAMAKAPGERFASCAEFAEAASAALEGVDPSSFGPPIAPPPPAVPPPATPTAPAEPAPPPPAEVAKEADSARPSHRILIGIGVLIVAAIVAAIVFLGGGEDAAPTGTLDLANDTASLADQVAKQTDELADAVTARDSTTDLAKSFDGTEEQASALEKRVTETLPVDDPIRASLRTANAGLADASTDLSTVADDPDARGARGDAKGAKNEMEDAVAGLGRAYGALERDLADAGDGDTAASVRSSLEELRDRSDDLTGSFDALIAAL